MRVLLLILTLTALPALAEGVWKWKDEHGVVHYSDQPGPGAVRVDLHTQTFSAPETPPPLVTPRQRRSNTSEQVYQSLEIWKPAAEETYPNTAGQVDVGIRLEPALRPSDTLALYLDGKHVDAADNSLDFTLTDVPRGTHSVAATITDNNTGKVVIQSPAVTFYVQQVSVAKPPVGPALRNHSRTGG
jgi:hypothetical protein